MTLQRFENEEFQLGVTPAGQSFTVEAPGLARALGFRDAYRLVESIPDEEKGYTTACTPGGDQVVWYLTEAGFYRAIGQRQATRIRDDAIRDRVARFQSWVYGDVLPAIRENGSYGQAPVAELSRRDLARMVIEEADRADAAEARAAELEGPAHSWDVLASGKGDYSVRDAAKILSRDPAISVGERRLFTELAAAGWIYRQRADGRWRVYQAQVDIGRMAELPQQYENPETREKALAAPQARIKVKGLQELHRLLGGVAPLQIGGAG